MKRKYKARVSRNTFWKENLMKKSYENSLKTSLPKGQLRLRNPIQQNETRKYKEKLCCRKI